ncbi:MAG TPA: amidohydrolase, partial [Erysipelotrichaceae bacterium]|nr:amidohydrolase [Erysipelotrichaceae bacterium]
MILIKNAKIFTMEDDILENFDILLKDGKILEIKKDLEKADAQIIDATDLNVYPGLIDAHSHVGIYENSIGWEGSDGNEMSDPITPEVRAIDGINAMDESITEANAGGVTTLCVTPGSANVVGGSCVVFKTAGVCIDDMVISDHIAMKAAFGENPKRVYKDGKIKSRMRTAQLLRELLFKTVEYKNKKDAAKGDVSKLPAFDMKLEAMLPVINKEIPLKIHAHRADDILTALRIVKEFNLDATFEHATEGHLIADKLKEANFPLLVGPTLSSKSKYELKNLTFKTPGILQKAGNKVAIITDSPVVPQQYLGLSAGLAVKYGMDEYEALKAITINPAEILKLDNRIGSLKVGKDADLIICDGNILDSRT